PLQQGDLTTARTALSYIVGRDTERLQEQGIARATIETVSENTADGITSPLFWAFLFGAPGLWVYKAVNTLDSMVGYQDERYAQFGKVSAKTDDLFNYIPARLTGLFIISFTKSKTAVHYHTRLKKWWIDAKRHVSPIVVIWKRQRLGNWALNWAVLRRIVVFVRIVRKWDQTMRHQLLHIFKQPSKRCISFHSFFG